jgi:hypothetical protein
MPLMRSLTVPVCSQLLTEIAHPQQTFPVPGRSLDIQAGRDDLAVSLACLVISSAKSLCRVSRLIGSVSVIN